MTCEVDVPTANSTTKQIIAYQWNQIYQRFVQLQSQRPINKINMKYSSNKIGNYYYHH